jgi:DNA-binding Xre family transcriptional regulator
VGHLRDPAVRKNGLGAHGNAMNLTRKACAQPTPTVGMASIQQPSGDHVEMRSGDMTMTDLIDTAPSAHTLTATSHLEPPRPPAPAGAGGIAARRWMVIIDGQRWRQLRRQRGLSQEMLADRAGVSTATVGRLERCDHPSCRGRTLARLAAVLGEQPAAIIPTDHHAQGSSSNPS